MIIERVTASLDELRAFVAVFESGGFTAASRRLALTTNAVSRRIQLLEDHLGVRLFDRTTRLVTPTVEARGYYERVIEGLATLDAAAEELRPQGDGLRGVVRIALPGVVASAAFLTRLRVLLDKHPRLAVELRITNASVDIVAEGLDIALVVGQVPASSFIGRPLGRVRWVLAATPAYLDRHGRPRRPEELASHRCLRLLSTPRQDEWTLVHRGGAEVTVAVNGTYEADDSRALGDATYAGLGIGIRPSGECSRAVKAGALERVLPAYRFSPLDVYALLPKGRLRIPRIAACLDALRAAVRQLG